MLERCKMNNIDKSIEYSQKSLDKNPNNLNSLINLAYCYQIKKKTQESVILLKRCLELTENHARIYDKLSHIYMNDLK